ncbi:CBS domain-containing protein [Actinophytocola sp.]|uniref:CBS domain-containing protein n=1 Tax=Actinophytocola sp. TaxID=1872138 RepID=UPI002D80367D|nr:CBS domain-containing protein [Actinophytocola sp.]HET9142217.1 CBS domain-containing protein [Actinophytocola sp.]
MTAQLTTKTVASVMSPDPVTVAMHTHYKDVLELLVARDVGAAAVVSATGRVLGVVSEADLLRTGRKSRNWRRRGRDVARLTAGALMATPALTVRSDATLAAAAKVLAESGKRQLFVVDDGRLVGMLARRAVLELFLRPDKEIRAEIEHDILTVPEPTVRVSVDHGVVQLTGWLPWRADVDNAVARVAWVPGVVGVRDRLVAAYDDR